MKKETSSRNKKKNNMKKIIITLVSFLGLSTAISIILQNLKKSKQSKKEDYDIVMESLSDAIKQGNVEKGKLSKDIAFRIIKFQFEKAKLAHRETLDENNICKLAEDLKEHMKLSCKYAADPNECAARVFGIDSKTLKEALKVFNCV